MLMLVCLDLLLHVLAATGWSFVPSHRCVCIGDQQISVSFPISSMSYMLITHCCQLMLKTVCNILVSSM